MVIALLIIIAGLLGFLIYDLEKFFPHYLDKKLDEHFKKNETIWVSLNMLIKLVTKEVSKCDTSIEGTEIHLLNIFAILFAKGALKFVS